MLQYQLKEIIKNSNNSNSKLREEIIKINKQISIDRIIIENVISDLKKHKILSNTYRCRRRDLLLDLI